MTTMEQYEDCVLTASNPVISSSQRSAASLALDSIRTQSSDGGTALCLELLKKSNNEQVTFYALGVLQQALKKHNHRRPIAHGVNFKRESVTFQQRTELRRVLLHNLTTIGASSMSPPKHIRVKIGIVLALLLRADFSPSFDDEDDTVVGNDTVLDELIQKLTLDETNNHRILQWDIYLRTMEALCDEAVLHIADEEDGAIMTQNETLLKDRMRGLSSFSSSERMPVNNNSTVTWNNTPSARIVTSILSILSQQQRCNGGFCVADSFSDGVKNHGDGSTGEIAVLALSVLKRFVSWIDLRLVVNDRIVPLLFSCLFASNANITESRQNGTDRNHESSPDVAKLQVQALECFAEVISRGMDHDKKVHLIGTDLNILARIQSDECGIDLEVVDGTDIHVVIKVAELTTLTGLELLQIWEDWYLTSAPITTMKNCDTNAVNASCRSVVTLLHQLMPLFFKCFAYDDIDVSGAVIPLALRLVVTLGKEMDSLSKKKDVNGGRHSGEKRTTNASSYSMICYITQLLTITYQQMHYPPHYQFDYEDEEDAEEEMYRTELRKLNQKIVTVCPDLSFQFLCAALSKLQLPLSSNPTSPTEAALRLVYHYCEGIRPPPGLKVVMKNESFRQLLVALHSSDIAMHPHREVLILYYDIAARYHSILKDQTNLLPNVLGAISGERGLQHGHPRVRSRSCYLLLRLVKALGDTMRPFVETAVGGIQGLLSNPIAFPIQPDDSLYLFETVGLLLGKTGLSVPDQQRYLTAVLSPHVCSVEEVLRSSQLQLEPASAANYLSRSIAAIAYLSKGFTKPASEVQLVLKETVGICLNALQVLAEYECIRSKSMVFLQRMIQCLDKEKLLPTMPNFLAILIPNCSQEDVLDVAQLLYQLCIKFKSDAASAIDEAVMPFLRHCHVLISKIGGGTQQIPPHLITEQLSIQKLTFAFLLHVVSHGVTRVLVSATNAPSLENVLKSMGDGAMNVQDAVMKRTCILFFRELIDQWGAAIGDIETVSVDMTAVQRGFFHYVYDDFLPGMFNCMLSPAFKEEDAMQSRNIGEMGEVLSSLKAKRGEFEFEQRVVVGSITMAISNSSASCPPDILTGFRNATGGKDMKTGLKRMLSVLKRR